MVIAIQLESEHVAVILNVFPISQSNAHDDATHRLLVQHPPLSHVRKRHPVLRRDAVQNRKQLLE